MRPINCTATLTKPVYMQGATQLCSFLKISVCVHEVCMSVRKAFWPSKHSMCTSPRQTHYRLCAALQGGVSFHKWEQEKVRQSGLFNRYNTKQEPYISSTWIVSNKHKGKEKWLKNDVEHFNSEAEHNKPRRPTYPRETQQRYQIQTVQEVSEWQISRSKLIHSK